MRNKGDKGAEITLQYVNLERGEMQLRRSGAGEKSLRYGRHIQATGSQRSSRAT